VTLSVKGVPLAAALQAIEDASPGVVFVIREYGFLATSDSSAAANESISAVELWREQTRTGSAGSEPKEPAAPPARGGGAKK
jgi:hypothetical protein